MQHRNVEVHGYPPYPPHIQGNYVYPHRAYGPAPESNLLWAIFGFAFFMPFGVVALVRSSEVARLWAQGREGEAYAAARAAKAWSVAAVVASVVMVVVIVAFFVTLASGA